MRIEPKYPPREYFCGRESRVLIQDIATVHLENGDQFKFANKLCVLNIKLQHWGYELLLQPKFEGNIVLSGASLVRSHLMFYATSEIQNFNEYQIDEDLRVFWSQIARQSPEACCSNEGIHKLRPNDQFTFCAGHKHDFDVTSKSWGFYLTPSLFHRCKKFELYPHVLRLDDKWKILMSFSDNQDFKHLVVGSKLSNELYSIDDLSGIYRAI
jgi:hypothetical protein